MKGVIATAVLVVALSLGGCSYHTLVAIEHDYKTTVKALQDGESNEFASGNVDAATHAKIEAIVLKLAQSGLIVNQELQAHASKATVQQTIDAVSADLQQLLSDGLSGIKNPTTKTNVKVLIQAVQAIVDNFQTALGGK